MPRASRPSMTAAVASSGFTRCPPVGGSTQAARGESPARERSSASGNWSRMPSAMIRAGEIKQVEPSQQLVFRRHLPGRLDPLPIQLVDEFLGRLHGIPWRNRSAVMPTPGCFTKVVACRRVRRGCRGGRGRAAVRRRAASPGPRDSCRRSARPPPPTWECRGIRAWPAVGLRPPPSPSRLRPSRCRRRRIHPTRPLPPPVRLGRFLRRELSPASASWAAAAAPASVSRRFLPRRERRRFGRRSAGSPVSPSPPARSASSGSRSSAADSGGNSLSAESGALSGRRSSTGRSPAAAGAAVSRASRCSPPRPRRRRRRRRGRLAARLGWFLDWFGWRRRRFPG